MLLDIAIDWFVSCVDNLIFRQSQAANDGKDKTTIEDDIPLVVTHPQIIISYQWDYQKDIGDEDSLFEKKTILEYVRQKFILSCATSKCTK
ncbi:unnamed protein product [Rotaria sp. Silwood1]|nr:unnamed protein product [Rotaria sp. Silwood1]CAF4786073.1 unnamed protein product [Rotaria sp. Silwood1]CAF4819747.1 unnamed protein product [Rotaria sp. Silwood1]